MQAKIEGADGLAEIRFCAKGFSNASTHCNFARALGSHVKVLPYTSFGRQNLKFLPHSTIAWFSSFSSRSSGIGSGKNGIPRALWAFHRMVAASFLP
jgi:hypothetical protein